MNDMALEDRRKAQELLAHAAALHTTVKKDGIETPAPIDHRPYELRHEEGPGVQCPVCEALLAIQEARNLLIKYERPPAEPGPELELRSAQSIPETPLPVPLEGEPPSVPVVPVEENPVDSGGL